MLRSMYVPYANHNDIEKAMDALERQVVYGTGADIVGNAATFAKEDQGGGRVGRWFTTPTVEATLKDALLAEGRWVYTGSARVVPDVGLGVERGPGQAIISHNAKPVLASRFCPDGAIYALDPDAWEIQILPHVLRDGGVREVVTDFAFVVLAKTGSHIKGYWEVYFNLVCNQPHRNGLIDGVA